MNKITSLLEIEQYVNNYSVFVFDLDDTLYSEKEYIKSGYKLIADGIPEIDAMAEKLWKSYEAGGNAIDTTLKNEGIFSEKLRTKCLEIYRNQIPNIHLYEDAKLILNTIKAERKKIGLITDGRPEGQRAKIQVLGLEAVFDHIIVTDELGGIEFRKPCCRAFELMRKKMDVPYSQMVYIGDNTKKDFIAPEKLGMDGIWFENKDGIYF